MSLREWWRRLAAMSGVQVFGILTGMMSVIVTARWLGPTGQGIIATVTAWTTLFASIGHLSLGQSAIFRATEERGSDWLPSTFGTLLALTVAISLCGWTVAGAMYLWPRAAPFGTVPGAALLAGFISLPFLLWDQHGGALLMAANQDRVYNIAQIVGRGLSLGLVLVAWLANAGVVAVIFAMTIGLACGRLIGVWLLWQRTGRRLSVSFRVARGLLANGLRLHLNFVGDFFIAQVNVLILDRMLDHAAAGQYQLAEYVITALMIVPQAAAMLLYGDVTAVGPDAAWVQQRRIVAAITGGMAAIAAVSAFAVPIIIPVAFGERFRPAIALTQLLLVTIVPMTLAKVMMSQWVGRGLFTTMSVLTLILGATNVVGMFYFIPRVGLIGVGVSAVCVYGIALLVQLVMVVVVERRTLAIRAT